MSFFKGFLSSGISSEYSYSAHPTFLAGSWQISDAKRKSSGRPVSVFIFDRKKLDSAVGRSSSIKNDIETTLRQEVQYLTKLRHPCILEVIEPLQERTSTFTFVTERICESTMLIVSQISSDSEKFDEVELQKGLIQLSQALEFVHTYAGLVHMNIQPTSIYIDQKGDWKLAGFELAQEYAEYKDRDFFIANYDSRLPKSVQMNYDYTAPELIIDRRLIPQNDIFSLGCLIIALYTGHSPLKTNQNLSTYKNSVGNVLRLSHQSPLPSYLVDILPKLLSRDPLQRFSDVDFQNSKYFDNILISTIRFLEDFPTKSDQEKEIFLKGLSEILNQFSTSLLRRKILPMLIEEFNKESDYSSYVLSSILSIGKLLSQLTFSSSILSVIAKVNPEKVVCAQIVLNHIGNIKEKTTNKEFQDKVLPLVIKTMEGNSLTLQEESLKAVPQILDKVDFTTMKNIITMSVCNVFSRTSSLAVKITAIKALEALCLGGLDRHTIIENILPLIKSMKTREPDVVMAACELYINLINILEIDQLALEVIPRLWDFLVSSILNEQQVKNILKSIKLLSNKVENSIIERAKSRSSTVERARSLELHSSKSNVTSGTFESLVMNNSKVPLTQKPKLNGNHTMTSSNLANTPLQPAFNLPPASSTRSSPGLATSSTSPWSSTPRDTTSTTTTEIDWSTEISKRSKGIPLVPKPKQQQQQKKKPNTFFPPPPINQTSNSFRGGINESSSNNSGGSSGLDKYQSLI